MSAELLDDLLTKASWDLEPVIRPFETDSDVSLHLAVFVEPYLSYVLDGSKTVESRFSRRPIAPHGCVRSGDVILLKPSGRPIIGWCRAVAVWSYELDPTSWEEIRDRFSPALRAQDNFWETRQAAQYATLIRIADVHEVVPTAVDKRDRRGWVVLADRGNGRLL